MFCIRNFFTWSALCLVVLAGAARGEETKKQKLERLERQKRLVELSKDFEGAIRDISQHFNDLPAEDRRRLDDKQLSKKYAAAEKLANTLKAEMQSATKWMPGEEGQRLAKKADEPLKLVKKMKNAQSNEDLIRYLEDYSKVVDKLPPVNHPGVNYLTLVNDAIKGIAKDARKLEKHSQRTKDAIKESRKAIGNDQSAGAVKYKSPLDEVIKHLEDEIDKAKQALDKLAYRDVDKARQHCMKKHKVKSFAEVRGWEKDARRLGRDIANKESAVKLIRGLPGTYKFLMNYWKKEVKELPNRGTTALEKLNIVRIKIPAAKARAKMYADLWERAQKNLTAKEQPMIAALKDLKKKHRENATRLQQFNRCVAKNLIGSKEATQSYLRKYFPEYLLPSKLAKDEDAAYESPFGEEAISDLAPMPIRRSVEMDPALIGGPKRVSKELDNPACDGC